MQTEIKLTQGRVAIIDTIDYPTLSRVPWHFKSGYASWTDYSGENPVRVWMHDVIMGVVGGVDHIDRDGLNNQRSNLRLATNSLQGHNRLMPQRNLPRGVSLTHGRYQASIRIDGRLVYLGRYDTPEDAYEVYRQKCLETHGEYPPEWKV